MTTDPNSANEAEIERQKSQEDWLPVTTLRKAKWWYSAFHNVTAMVGAGAISLPFALSQVFAMPLFDTIESFLVIRLKMSPSPMLRLIARCIYVCITIAIGVCVPFSGGLLGFFGGLTFAPASFFLPCVMWLILRKPKVFSLHWKACWISIILGVMLMLLCIGGLITIILLGSTYKFFS